MRPPQCNDKKHFDPRNGCFKAQEWVTTVTTNIATMITRICLVRATNSFCTLELTATMFGVLTNRCLDRANRSLSPGMNDWTTKRFLQCCSSSLSNAKRFLLVVCRKRRRWAVDSVYSVRSSVFSLDSGTAFGSPWKETSGSLVILSSGQYVFEQTEVMQRLQRWKCNNHYFTVVVSYFIKVSRAFVRFINRDDVDFDVAETYTPIQTFDLVQGSDDVIEYATR